jgi:SAM-dependent methyltransferase
MREQPTVFGEVAQTYDDARPGYPDALVDRVLAYAGRRPAWALEVGAGTGKATEAFVRRDVPIRCVEPDARMAAVLRARFAAAAVSVEVARFEDWTAPTGGVPLLFCAQAWHWVDPERRLALARDALAPDGVLALFGHQYAFADPALERALDDVYLAVAPELHKEVDAGPTPHWLHAELAGQDLFTDVAIDEFVSVVPYPTPRYLALVSTFSPHRMLPEDRRNALWHAIAETIDAHGGTVGVRLETTLALGRRNS